MLARGCAQGGGGSYASDELGEHDGGNLSQCLMVTGLLLSSACTCMSFQCLDRNMHPTFPTEQTSCSIQTCIPWHLRARSLRQDGNHGWQTFPARTSVQTRCHHQSGCRSVELMQHTMRTMAKNMHSQAQFSTSLCMTTGCVHARARCITKCHLLAWHRPCLPRLRCGSCAYRNQHAHCSQDL